MKQPSNWLERRLKRIDFLAELLESHGFTNIANELRALRTEAEVKNLYDAFKGWMF